MYDIIRHMKRTTIFVPAPIERDLQLYARHERKSVAWVVREAIAEYLASRRPAPALPSFVGVGRSGRRDVAERHEELLWADPHDRGLAENPTRSRPARKRPAARRTHRG
jgi:hypothetical protein